MGRKLPIQIMIIDDDTEYVNDLKNNAERLGITLVHFETLQEGKTFFVKNEISNISGVILDVIGLIDIDQEIPKENFIGKALEYFNQNHPKLPKIVLTAETSSVEDLSKYHEDTFTVFNKNQEPKVFLNFIKKEALLIIKFLKWYKKYPEIMEIFFEKYLDEEAQDKLLDCLSKINSSNKNSIKHIIDNIRYLLEMIFIKINKINPKIIPTELIYSGIDDKESVKQPKIFAYLLKNNYIEDKNSIINKFLWDLYTISSGKSVHFQTSKYPPTKYTAQALIFQLFDVLLWFKKIVDSEF